VRFFKISFSRYCARSQRLVCVGRWKAWTRVSVVSFSAPFGYGNLDRQLTPCARDMQQISFMSAVSEGFMSPSLAASPPLSFRLAFTLPFKQFFHTQRHALRYITCDIPPPSFPLFSFVYISEVGQSILLVRVTTSVLITTTADTIHSFLSLPPFPVLVDLPTTDLLASLSD